MIKRTIVVSILIVTLGSNLFAADDPSDYFNKLPEEVRIEVLNNMSKMSEQDLNLNRVPGEMRIIILSELTTKDLNRDRQTSKEFNQASNKFNKIARDAAATWTSLELQDLQDITDENVATIAKICPKLQEINLSQCNNLTDAAAASLAACPGLQSVNFTWCNQLTDEAAASLAACPSLQSVNFSECPNLTDAGIAVLQRARPKLKIIR